MIILLLFGHLVCKCSNNLAFHKKQIFVVRREKEGRRNLESLQPASLPLVPAQLYAHLQSSPQESQHLLLVQRKGFYRRLHLLMPSPQKAP
ncbi:hypothetical protein DAI22_05g181733 [Oryza sativa Japonica Group]|nr:hypothetical protein DAI22_05g181733 [Oryza sativa Japonica Group]